ncbi:hypothetical protein QYF36_003858 [Acer negundo]|nr:hypothetical protein QYF36_003858 [Acer negundo]
MEHSFSERFIEAALYKYKQTEAEMIISKLFSAKRTLLPMKENTTQRNSEKKSRYGRHQRRKDRAATANWTARGSEEPSDGCDDGGRDEGN